MLRLVHPAPGGQGTDPPRRRKGSRPDALSLTAEEQRHTRAALRNAARAYGSWGCLASAMRMPERTVVRIAYEPKRPLSGTFAIRLARAAGVAVEAVLSGKLTAAGRCPTCGHRAGDGRAVAAGGVR